MTAEEREQDARDRRDRMVAVARDERDRAKAELDRLGVEMDEIKAAGSALPARIVSWARNLPPGTAVRLHNRRIRLPDGDLRQGLTEQRQKLRDLEAERQVIDTAPLPSSMARELVRKEIDRLAELGRPDVMRTTEIGMPPRFAVSKIMDAAGSPGLQQYFDGVSTLCWLFRDQVVEAMDRELAEIADDANALSPSDRQRRLAELELAELSVERLIEATIEAAEAQGIEIKRADNASPIAVLNLSDDLLNLTSDRRTS
jgi:hypothetical protein